MDWNCLDMFYFFEIKFLNHINLIFFIFLLAVINIFNKYEIVEEECKGTNRKPHNSVRLEGTHIQ